MEEIKNLKLMLEGKAPVLMPSNSGSLKMVGSDHVIRERVAEGSGSNLEEELKSKESQLRSEQE